MPQGVNKTGKSTDSRDPEVARILEDTPRDALFCAIGDCRDAADIQDFLLDLCTKQELDALAERWLIARLLHQGDLSYRDISALTGASTTTIGRVARFLQQEPHEGYKRILERQNRDKTRTAKS